MSDNDKLRENLAAETARCSYWERRALEREKESKYYQTQLVDAHALIGRIVHQVSERWDTVNLTKYFPTDNLHRQRSVGNPTGEDSRKQVDEP